MCLVAFIVETTRKINNMEDIIMRKEYTVEQMAGTRWFYTFIEPNAKGEKIVMELSKCTNPGGSNAIPVLWNKHGYMDRVLETYWSIQTYVTDTEGYCHGMYNPQEKPGRYEINFNWMFEATEENKEKLIDEVYRLASSANGETATERKHRKIKEFAAKEKVELLTEIPEGWKELKGSMTAPIGTVWVSNREPFKSGNRKSALLLVC